MNAFSRSTNFPYPNPHLLQQIVSNEAERGLMEKYRKKNGVSKGEAQRRLGATGLMECPTGMATVQVVNTGTEPSNVVTTAAHPFYDGSCQYIAPSACKVFFPFSSSQEPFTIDGNSLKVGGCSRQDQDTNKDWAVFRLDRSVPGVVPHGIPDRGTKPKAAVGARIVLIDARPLQFPKSLPYIEKKCEIKDRYYSPFFPVQTDCNTITGGGTSGAGQYISNQDRYELVAIVSGEYKTRDATPNYNRDNNFGISVPVSEKFLEIIHDMLGTPK